MRKVINGLFAAVILMMIFGGSFRTVFMPNEINEYENRYAEKLHMPTASTVLNGEFQGNVEAALADQVFYAEDIKEGYNRFFSKYNKAVLDSVNEANKAQKDLLAEAPADPVPAIVVKPPIETAEAVLEMPLESEKEPEPEEIEIPTIRDPDAFYYTLPSGRLILEDHLMYAVRYLEGDQSKLDKRIANINYLAEKYPDIDIRVFYVEKETDIDFVSGERSGVFEYLSDNIDLPEENKNHFHIVCFEDFDRMFYRTDHHFNHRGAYECYKQLLGWLLQEETPLEPTGEYEIGYYSGSKATGPDAEVYKDVNTCYTFDYPEMITYENGKKVGYYGAQEYYINKVKEKGALLDKVTYGQLFGQDSGEIKFETPSKETGSILVFGESFDNAVLRLLASHFNRLYSIDLRNYKAQVGKSFNLDSYLKEHPDIDRILLIGNLDYYILNTFNLK